MTTRLVSPEEKTYAAELLTRARTAMQEIESYDQARVDRLCQALGWATANEKTFDRIARLGVEESGLGDPDGRVGKRFKIIGILSASRRRILQAVRRLFEMKPESISEKHAPGSRPEALEHADE